MLADVTNLAILVTGGAGFIGSHIVEELLKRGAPRVRVIDNLATGNMNNIAPLLARYPNLEFMYGDVSNLEDCRKAVKGMSAISHQAALGSVPRSVEEPLPSHISNVNGFLNILIAAKDAHIKRVVYASSSSVYGDSQALPKVESCTGNVLSPYAATKAIDEIYAGVFTECYGVECVGLRYFNIFGPRQNPNGAYAAVIPKFIDAMRLGTSPLIHGDGEYSRDFTYVDNAVLANVLALTTTNRACFGTAFNVGAGARTTMNELVDIINSEMHTYIVPTYGPTRFGDIPHSYATISKAAEMLGYTPIVSFKTGISALIRLSTSTPR